MNLWVKRIALGLTAAVALFLFACLDEENILGFPNQNQKFKMSYVEIPLESSVLLFDSLRTSNHYNDPIRRLLVGRYNDPIFGAGEAEAYTQIIPNNSTQAKPTTAVYDSVSLVLHFDSYHYGSDAANLETYSIHEVTQRLTYRKGNEYYSKRSVAYDAAALGQKSLNLSAERLDSMATRTDTTVTISIPLADEYGQRLFNAWDAKSTSFTNFETFASIFKGLAIVGGASNQKVVGVSIGANTKLVVHYHTDTVALAYNFLVSSVVSTSKVVIDRSASDLSNLVTPYEAFTPSNADKLYIQSGVPIVTKINLSAFAQHFENIDNVLINSAELSISQIDAPGDFDPPNSLYLHLLGNNNRLKKFKVTTQDTVDLTLYNKTITNGLQGLSTVRVSKDSIFTIISDTQQSLASLSYNSDTKSYKSFITLFAQELYDDESVVRDNITTTKTKFYDLVLYPGDPYAAKSMNRVRFNKSNLKLKIYYSTPISSTTN